jgi:hypothetical protein
MFVDEEAEDSDENHFEDKEEDDTDKDKSTRNRSTNRSDEEDDRDSLTEYKIQIKKHDSQLCESVTASRSHMKLDVKVSFSTDFIFASFYINFII